MTIIAHNLLFMSKRIAPHVVFVFLAVFIGRASVAWASEDIAHLAKSLKPLPGSTGIYIFRASHVLSFGLEPIYLDDSMAENLAVKSYIYWTVTEGNHTIKENPTTESLYAEPGKNFYFIITDQTAAQVLVLLQGFHPIKQISETEASKYMKSFTFMGYCGFLAPVASLYDREQEFDRRSKANDPEAIDADHKESAAIQAQADIAVLAGFSKLFPSSKHGKEASYRAMMLFGEMVKTNNLQGLIRASVGGPPTPFTENAKVAAEKIISAWKDDDTEDHTESLIAACYETRAANIVLAQSALNAAEEWIRKNCDVIGDDELKREFMAPDGTFIPDFMEKIEEKQGLPSESSFSCTLVPNGESSTISVLREPSEAGVVTEVFRMAGISYLRHVYLWDGVTEDFISRTAPNGAATVTTRIFSINGVVYRFSKAEIANPNAPITSGTQNPQTTDSHALNEDSQPSVITIDPNHAKTVRLYVKTVDGIRKVYAPSGDVEKYQPLLVRVAHCKSAPDAKGHVETDRTFVGPYLPRNDGSQEVFICDGLNERGFWAVQLIGLAGSSDWIIVEIK